MVYLGSKNKLAKDIIPIIQKYIDDNNITTYIEPFTGGANVIDKVKCKKRIGSDYNNDLIALLKYAQTDDELLIAPKDCSFEHYKEVRADKEHKIYSKEYRALIGYMASYGGRFFDGGYGRSSKDGRNIYNERLANLKRQIPNIKDIEFSCRDYKEYLKDDIRNALFYLDPPYKDTKQYAKQSIIYDEFYDFCRQIAKDNIVLISEFQMPDDFTCIWEKERKILLHSTRTTGSAVTEKLFTI